jgi:hypothetical protein
MSNVIFVQPRHNYGTYQDYFRLVELSGYRWLYEDEIDLSSTNTYILTWFGVQSAFSLDTKARLICWNLEWANVPVFPNVEYWTPDAWFALKNGWKYVPVGSHKALYCDDYRTHLQIYDVALQMYRDPLRRAHMIHRFRDAGLKIAPDGWQEVRHRSLMQSRCMVHIHQLEDNQTISPLRFALAAAYRLPVISESLTNVGILRDCVVESPYHDMPEAIIEWLKPNRSAELQRKADALYTRLVEQYSFRTVVEAAL